MPTITPRAHLAADRLRAAANIPDSVGDSVTANVGDLHIVLNELSRLSRDDLAQCGRTYVHDRHSTTEGTCPGLNRPDRAALEADTGPDDTAEVVPYDILHTGLRSVAAIAIGREDYETAAYAYSVLAGSPIPPPWPDDADEPKEVQPDGPPVPMGAEQMAFWRYLGLDGSEVEGEGWTVATPWYSPDQVEVRGVTLLLTRRRYADALLASLGATDGNPAEQVPLAEKVEVPRRVGEPNAHGAFYVSGKALSRVVANDASQLGTYGAAVRDTLNHLGLPTDYNETA